MSWKQLLKQERFPLSSSYDPEIIGQNHMGPNALWIMEWLSEAVTLKPGMRVLDLGCGSAISSIFLAKEFGVTVFAADLWISAEENLKRIDAAGVGDKVFPFQAEAHALPFAPGFFDLVLSVDSYQYYGTDNLYLGYLLRFVKPDGRVAVAMPGLTREFGEEPPAHLLTPQKNGAVFWEPEMWTFHSPAWWRRHWEKLGQVDVLTADNLEDGWRYWMIHDQAMEQAGQAYFPSGAESLEADGGRYIGFVRLVAAPKPQDAESAGMPHVWEKSFEAVASEVMNARGGAPDKD